MKRITDAFSAARKELLKKKRAAKKAIWKKFDRTCAAEGEQLLSGRPSAGLCAAFRILKKTARSQGYGKTESCEAMEELRRAVLNGGEHPALTEEGLIGNQRRLRQIPLGKNGNMADHGCGWAAAYNVEKLLGKTVDPEEVLSYLTRGIRKNGRGGIHPVYLCRYLMSRGCRVGLYYEKEEMERSARSADAFVLLYVYARTGRCPMGHYAAGRPDPETGTLLVYNGEQPPMQQVASLSEAESRRTLLRVLVSVNALADE